MKKCKIKTSFVSLESPLVNNTIINFFYNFILIFVENCLLYDAIHYFSEWLKTVSNSADINPFLSYTEKKNFLALINLSLFSWATSQLINKPPKQIRQGVACKLIFLFNIVSYWSNKNILQFQLFDLFLISSNWMLSWMLKC